MTASGTFLLATTIALLALLAGTLIRKGRRDHVERASLRARAQLRAALLAGTGDTLLSAAANGRRSDQEDAIAVLMSGAPSPPHREHPALQRQLSARDPATRGRAVVLLSLLGLPGTVELLRPLLGDRDLDVRLATANAIERVGGAGAVPSLLQALDDGQLARARVVERLAHDWAVEPMLDAALTASPGARTAIWQALGLAHAGAGVHALRAVLRGGEDEERIAAARALGQIDVAGVENDLVRALADRRWEVRAQAATALGLLGATAAVPALRAAVEDRAWWVRSNAATALSRLGPAGRAALEDARDGSDRYAAERADEALLDIAATAST